MKDKETTTIDIQDIQLDGIPAQRHEGFRRLAEALREAAGDNLLGLVAFGGWLADDPYFADSPATSAAVLSRIDLDALDALSKRGPQLGRWEIRAPLIMTPVYLEASRDAFPLELLEIQQRHARILGEDHFAPLVFDPRDLRLQCERELKSELIHLRQGLLAAGGRYALLHEVCQQHAARTIRVLRGVLHLSGDEPPRTAREFVERAAARTGCTLDMLLRLVTVADDLGIEGFKTLYDEIALLCDYVDQWRPESG